MKYTMRKSKTEQLREHYLKKKIELVNITPLCSVRLGMSGWCNDFNSPDESIHHVQLLYRDKVIANIGGDRIEVIDDNWHIIHTTSDGDFIVYLKVPVGWYK